jgi:hypothetical protein
MSRVLLAWELGAHLGHIDRLAPLAQELQRRGHEPVLLLRDLSRAQSRVMTEGLWVGQAPVWLPRLTHPPRIGNHAAVLAEAGWMDAQGLAGLVQGWRNAFDLLRPDLLVCDHAPTALLAARGRFAGPVWAVGTSFELPPPGPAFPPFAFWEPVAPDPIGAAETQVLQPVQAALRLLGDAPLTHLGEVYEGARRALATVPLLAHYRGYGTETPFCGPIWRGDAGAVPDWPERVGPRVLAYLDPNQPTFGPVTAALAELRWPVLLHARGMGPQAAARLAGAGLGVSAGPLRMDALLPTTQIVVHHGGLGTASAALAAGCAQLLLPTQMEQLMLARRLESAGLARAAVAADVARATSIDWKGLLRQVADPTLRKRAQQAALDLQDKDPARTVADIAARIESSLQR